MANIFPDISDVLIVGAGFSGSAIAVHLASAGEPLKVILAERNHVYGPGLAYSTPYPEHLLNVPAKGMSAFPDKPDHFYDWALSHPEEIAEFGDHEVTEESFLPRGLYGRYLSWLVRSAALRSDRLKLLNSEVTDIKPQPDDTFIVYFNSHVPVQTRSVVLAWGNFPPTISLKDGAIPIHHPWSEEARQALKNPGDVLIIGTGLTALDLLASATRLNRKGKLHVLSRHGRFPQLHKIIQSRPSFLDKYKFPTSIRQLFRLVRTEVRRAEKEGSDWRAVIDSLRAFTQEIWINFSPVERRRFLRHVRSLWEILRHRAAPAMRSPIQTLESQEQLTRHRGRLLSVDHTEQRICVQYQPYGEAEKHTLYVDSVINATGPESDPRRIKAPLLKNLLLRGLVQPNPLGLGVELTHGGPTPTPNKDPLFSLGSLRRGALWESTAVPELRVQAKEIAQQLIRQFAVHPTSLSPSIKNSQIKITGSRTAPDHYWIFEI